MGQSNTPGSRTKMDKNTNERNECEAEGCTNEGVYPAPRSRNALRDYKWFCLEHVREYNKSWNYYEGLQGAALEAEIRRATTWERPSWKFATGTLSEDQFTDTLGLFNFDRKEPHKRRKKLTREEQEAWDVLQLEPVNDIDAVKKQYKRLVKENHPDKNKGDVQAEERLKDINLAFSLIRKSLSKIDKSVVQ